jgi:hypothetical protein
MAYQNGRSITANGRDYAARERELMMKQKGETEQDSGVTPDEKIARKEMEEGVRWAIRENFNEQQVNFPVPLCPGRSTRLATPHEVAGGTVASTASHAG